MESAGVLCKLQILFNPVLFFRILKENRFLLWQLVLRNICIRYKGAFFGLLWSFVQPLLMLCVYTFVFSVVFKSRWGGIESGRGAFAIIMFCGMALFSVFSESVSSSCRIILGNQNYVKKVIFPLEILPLAQCLSTFILGFAWLVLLFLGVVFVYGSLSWTMLLLPLILIPLFLFTCGICFFVASVGVYLRDTQYIVGVILQILFFMTPIFYSIDSVPAEYRWPLQMNPLTILIEECRRVFLFGKLPNWSFLSFAFLIGIVVLHLGFVWFYKTKRGFADVL